MLLAITRPVSPTFAACALTHLARSPIDVDLARRQHAAYESALQAAGARVLRVPEAPAMPDAVFIEDTAVVLDEVAVITRPGADSRRGEIAAVAPVLEQYRPMLRLEAPARLDGDERHRAFRIVHARGLRRGNGRDFRLGSHRHRS